MRLTLIVALLFVMAACATWRGIPESWHGRHNDELVAAWGPPHMQHVNADRSRVAAYTHQHQVSGFNPYAPYQTAVYACSVTFNIGSDGLILSSRVEGNLGGCNTLFRHKSKAP
jgi:hypothetical protein